MTDVTKIADSADMVVNGYAFSRRDDGIQVLNLNNPDRASLLSLDGQLLETSMDDIEIRIVQDYYQRNRQFMEAV